MVADNFIHGSLLPGIGPEQLVRYSRTFSCRVVIPLAVFCAALGACGEDTAPVSLVPAITVTTTASSIFLAEGDRASIDVTVTRSASFAGAVTLAVAGLPAGTAANVTTNPVTGDRATVELVVGANVVTGTYRLTLTATGEGIEAKSVTIDLHVVAPNPSEVTVVFCSVLAPTWIAFQDGNGEWTRATPNAVGENTIFRHVFVTDRGGIATVTSALDGALTLLNVLFGTPAELASVGDTNPIDCGASLAKSLFGSVGGLGPNESALISAGPFLRASVPVGRSTFHLTGLPAGPRDLLATRTTESNGSAAVTSLLLRRDIDLPDSGSIGTLDFSSLDAFAPAIANVRIGGLGPEGAISGTRLRTSNSEMVLSFLTAEATAITRPYFALPENKLTPGDLQVLHVSTGGPSDVNRDADVYFRAAADRTVLLGALLFPPRISAVATTPSLRVRAQFDDQAEYDRATTIVLEQGPSSTLVTLSMTTGYAALTGGFDLIVPDLSAVAGFDPAWALRPGVQLIWSATRVGGTLALGRDAVPSEGTTQLRAFRRDTITVR